jgi:transporter family-2 protein
MAAVSGGLTVGACLAGQAFLNGRLGVALGTPELAGAICVAVALMPLLALGTANGSISAARRAWSTGQRPRHWHWIGAFCAAAPIIILAQATPRIGVAAVTVAMVAGMATGSLILDARGLVPGGARPVTRRRVVGASLALAAVILAALGSGDDIAVGLFLLTIATGVAVAGVQTAIGHLAETFDDIVGATLSFAGAMPLTIVAWLVATGGRVPGGWDPSAAELLGGGLLGAVLTVLVARVVSSIGSLLLTLTLVAGQSAAALAIDVVAPVGAGPGALTAISLVLVFTAVLVSSDLKSRATTG